MKVLFLGMHMNGLHGSFLHILEYARYFKSRGDEIYVGSVFIDQKNRELLESGGIVVNSSYQHLDRNGFTDEVLITNCGT